MKNFYSFLLLFVFHWFFSQDFFYKSDATSVAVVGQESTITFEKPAINKGGDFSEDKSVKPGILNFLDANLNTFVNLGYKIIKNKIDRDVLKYTDSFSVKRTYLYDNRLPAFKIKREIITKDTKERITAFSATFIPSIVKNNALVYKLLHVECNLSGAKVWEKTNFNNYEIKLNMVYSSGDKKEIHAFNTLKIPLVEIGNSEKFNIYDENNEYKYATDLFIIPDDFVLLEMFASVQETSASKVKADKVQRIKDDYSEDTKVIVDKFIRYLREHNKLGKEENQ